jgi:hypothetical protein
MVGDSAGLRQEADVARQKFAALSQQAGGLQGELDRASDDQKSLIEGRISVLKGQIAGAMGDVNRTSADYSSAVSQEKTEELMKEVKEDEERIKQQEQDSAKELEAIRKKEQEKEEVVKEELLFLSDFGGAAKGDAADFTTENVGGIQKDIGSSGKKEEASTNKAIAGAAVSS